MPQHLRQTTPNEKHSMKNLNARSSKTKASINMYWATLTRRKTEEDGLGAHRMVKQNRKLTTFSQMGGGRFPMSVLCPHSSRDQIIVFYEPR
ncbi:hypothetical protein OESDEN_23061 [Oesophagostomum dentatum]|uniref:Uncharacterized protein n=1 Tax=Oesophagostomum dentatum TaxID=61180 RepID=A0A0B1RX99_OESDE|nr:hypothetical protein OESDEN_23061 [Oesophagostomum dentatum]